MGLKIFQIEKIALHIHDQKLEDPYSTQSDSPSQDFLFSHRKVGVDLRWIHKTVTIKTSGLLVGEINKSTDALLQELRSIVGMPTNIIAYYINDTTETISKCHCACYSECKDCKLTWLQTFGALTDVSISRGDPFEPATIDLTIEIYEFWRNLNVAFWHWGGGENIAPLNKIPVHANTVSEYQELLGFCPTCDMLFACDDCVKAFRRINYEDCDEFVYDPLFWQAYHCQCNDCSHGVVQSSETVNRWYNINVPKSHWGAPPLSLYSMTNLPSTGDIYIQVFHEDNMVSCMDETSLSIDDLNVQLNDAGWLPIQPTDVLWFGEVREYFNNKLYSPAFIKRNGVIIQDVHPAFNYTTFFPGMLWPGLNRVFIDIPDSNRDALVAFWHQFRRL